MTTTCVSRKVEDYEFQRECHVDLLQISLKPSVLQELRVRLRPESLATYLNVLCIFVIFNDSSDAYILVSKPHKRFCECNVNLG